MISWRIKPIQSVELTALIGLSIAVRPDGEASCCLVDGDIFGIFTYQYDNAVHQILPDTKVGHLTGATPEDLKRAIAEGKIVIAVGWNSTLGVALDAIQGKGWNIGHYKVVIKYDNEKIYFLDPGAPGDAKELASESWDQFLKDWSQGNFAIEPNSMWSISLEKP